MNKRVLLARVTGAHGLKGEVKIAAFTEKPGDVAAYGPLSDAKGERHFEISSLRAAGAGNVIARIKGVEDRNQAEALRGTELYISRSALPPAGEGEFYHSDLIGLSVLTQGGEVLGEVIAIQNFGAGDLLEVRASGSRQSELIPFEEAHVPEVDLEAGRVTIIRPAYEQAGDADAE